MYISKSSIHNSCTWWPFCLQNPAFMKQTPSLVINKSPVVWRKKTQAPTCWPDGWPSGNGRNQNGGAKNNCEHLQAERLLFYLAIPGCDLF